MRQSSKVLTQDQLQELRSELAAARRKLVFTNGCFDLLHAGHVHYLLEAKRLGDYLLVGINSDQSVQALKGPGRPHRSEKKRLEMLSRLDCVDGILVFDNPHVTELLLEVRPDLYAKGGDYTIDGIDAGLRDVLQREKIPVHFLGFVPGISTTILLETLSPEKLRELEESGDIARSAGSSHSS
jgi:rfaE bifunctional protein nucleotidyltransferase chain/domain